MKNEKVEYLINMINDMDIKDKLRLAICMSQSKWSGLIIYKMPKGDYILATFISFYNNPKLILYFFILNRVLEN